MSQEEYTEYSDEALVEKAKQADIEAFRAIVERYQGRIIAVAQGIVHNHDDAKDVAQEVFLKVYRSLDNFQGNSKFYTWLYRITINLAIDFSRKIKRRAGSEYNDAVEVKPEMAMADPKKSQPDERMYNKEVCAKLQEAIDSLSDDQKKAFVLREMEDMSYQEIAEVMNCSVGTVMSRLFYSREKIRVYLKKYL